jgi:hypothetical protein
MSIARVGDASVRDARAQSSQCGGYQREEQDWEIETEVGFRRPRAAGHDDKRGPEDGIAHIHTAESSNQRQRQTLGG